MTFGEMSGDEAQSKPRDFWARWAYERLRVLQPHVETAGIFEHAGLNCIVCPRLKSDSRATDGTQIREWFDSNCRPAGIPIQLVSALPNGAREVSPRTLTEAIESAGDPLTGFELFSELSLRLPSTFPLTGVEDGTSPMTVQIRVSRKLTPEEERELNLAIESLQQPWRRDIVVAPIEAILESPAAPLAPRAGLPPLMPSRLLFGVHVRSSPIHVRTG